MHIRASRPPSARPPRKYANHTSSCSSSKKRLRFSARVKRSFSRFEKITEARYRLGQGQEQDLSKAQLEITSILEQLEMRGQEAGRRQAELKMILGRDVDSPDIAIGEVEPGDSTIDERLQQLPSERSPELKMAEAMETRSVEALNLVRENYFPDFSFGYMYQKTGPGLRDYYMLTMGAKVPLYFWRKQTPAVEQATLEKQAAHNETRARELEIKLTLRAETIAARAASRVMIIYRDGLIPQSQATRTAALNGYRVGKADFQAVLSAAVDALNVTQGYYRALADHEIAIAKLQQIAGDTP